MSKEKFSSYFTDFLICSSSDKDKLQKENYKTLYNLKRNNISKVQIRHKNIIKSFLQKDNDNNFNNNKNNKIIPELDNYNQIHKSKKSYYNNFFELDKNTSLIYWEDELSIFDNIDNDNKKDDYLSSNQYLLNCENDRMLIINVKNNLLFIDINSFECVKNK
jgi:hypothetical protein